MATIWQQYGLEANPFNTGPLIEGGKLDIDKAFIGREKERETIDQDFTANDNLNIAVVGEVGIGKTTLVNFQKYVWKYRKEEKGLFSSRREIEVTEEILDKANFLLEIISSLIKEIQLLDPELLKKNSFLQKLSKIIDLSEALNFNVGLSGGVPALMGGINFGKGENIHVPTKIPTSALEQHFRELIAFVTSKRINSNSYAGVIIHVNNFDIILRRKDGIQKVRNLFHELRDTLQTDDCNFVFLGPPELYSEVILTESRIKSIFHHPCITLKPLAKTELVQALDERLEILKSREVTEYIKPYSKKLIYSLYELYDGDIRMIFNSMSKLVAASASAKQFDDELGMYRLAKILLKEINLSDKQSTVLLHIAEKGQISQRQIADDLGLEATNVAGYYFEPLKKRGLVEVGKTDGRKKFWTLTKQYKPLKYLKLENKIKNQVQDISEQMAMDIE